MKPCRRARYIPVAILIASIAAASACDTRELVAPAARGIAPRASVDAAQALGTTLLAPPPNSAPGVATSNPYEQFATVPESSWVVVNVSGQVKLTWNAEPCARRQAEAPYWACQTGSPTGTFAPSSPWEGGPVSIRGSWSDGGTQLIGLRGSGGSGESGGSAVGLYYNSTNTPMTLSGRVAANAVWAWDPNSGNGPFSWYMGGGYTVTATAVPSPFQVTESEPDADGYVTYTAEALYELQFLNPLDFYWNPPAGAARWFFSFADPDSDIPDRSGWGWEVNECTNQLVCRFKPPTDVRGRMQATAYVETRAARARSSPRPSPCGAFGGASFGADVASDCDPPRIEVVCKPNPVERAQFTQCEANARPRGDLQVTKWWFDDGAGHIIRPPDADGDSSFYWGGAVVIGGTVHAEGTIDGRPAVSGSTTLVVTDRHWKFTYPDEPSPIWDRGDSLTYPPVQAYGDTIGDGVLGTFWGGFISAQRTTLAQNGPNAGASYFSAASINGPLEIRLNAGLRPSDPWYKAQVGPNRRHPQGCGPAYLEREVPHTARHESGHYAIAKAFWSDPEIATRVERTVRFGPAGADELQAEITSVAALLKDRQAVFDAGDYGILDCDPYPVPGARR